MRSMRSLATVLCLSGTLVLASCDSDSPLGGDDGIELATSKLPAEATAQLKDITSGAGSRSGQSASYTIIGSKRLSGSSRGAVYATHLLVERQTPRQLSNLLFSRGVRVEIEFDAQGRWLDLESETDGAGIPHVVLHSLTGFPSAILTYVEGLYPGQEVIEEVERKLATGLIEVELLDESQYTFDANGVVKAHRSNGSEQPSPIRPVVVNEQVATFISTYLPGSSVNYAKPDVENGASVSKYYLNTGYKLTFGSDNAWLEVEGDDDIRLSLPESVLVLLPQSVRDYYTSRRLKVYSMERNALGYSVELSNDTEAYFDLNGRFVRLDD